MSAEVSSRFRCFGGTVGIHAGGRDAGAVVEETRLALLDAQLHLSRFDPHSELSRLNRDPRKAVPVGPLLLELAVAVRRAGLLSGGVVDATLFDEVEAAGYVDSREGADFETPSPPMLGAVPTRPAATGEGAWRQVSVDHDRSLVIRPPGVRIDGGGIAKGLLADLLGEPLERLETFAIDCCGDLRIGGHARRPRTVLIDDPYGGPPIHELALHAGGVATSGITKRAWRTGSSGIAHQLIDPATGRPAFTGVVQVTALAPTAFEAEVLAKQALLSGSARAAEKLPYGGVVVQDDGNVEIIPEAGLVDRALVRA
jgi:thiamine biosynthesis lipoprotein